MTSDPEHWKLFSKLLNLAFVEAQEDACIYLWPLDTIISDIAWLK